MRKIYIILCVFFLLASAALLFWMEQDKPFCLTGAFLADRPAAADILAFQQAYSKKPYLVMLFLDWGKYPETEVMRDIYAQDCVPLITWEPWDAIKKQGVDYDGLLEGKYDKYIADFSARLKQVKKGVFLRFAHEPNGNWYPWSGANIGKDKYVRVYRHVKDIFDKNKVKNVRWIFSVNCEDEPKARNSFLGYYPGASYADYVGIDGYNWGDSQPWSSWAGFSSIFMQRYKDVIIALRKPVLISEFSSVSSGGDKAEWIKEAMNYLKIMPEVKGFVLFNVNKEGDWNFPAGSEAAKKLKEKLQNPYFRDKI